MRKSVGRAGKVGGVGSRLTYLGPAWEERYLPMSVGRFLLDPVSAPRPRHPCPVKTPLPAYFLQHQQQVSIFAQSPWYSSLHSQSEPVCQMLPFSVSRAILCEGGVVTFFLSPMTQAGGGWGDRKAGP